MKLKIENKLGEKLTDDQIIEKEITNSYLGNLKKVPSYDIRALEEKMIINPKTHLFKQRTENLLEKTKDPSQIILVNKMLEQMKQQISRYEYLDLQREIREKSDELNKAIKKERTRDVYEVKKILELKNIKTRGKKDKEILRLAKQNNISFNKAKANTPEELIVNVASFRTTTKKDFNKELKKLNEEYKKDPNIINTIKKTNETLLPEFKPIVKKTDDYLTFKDIPTNIKDAKQIFGITKKEFDKEKLKIITNISREKDVYKKDVEKLIDKETIDKKALTIIIDRKTRQERNIPIMEFDIEERYKDLVGISQLRPLNIFEKADLSRKLEKPKYYTMLAGKKTIPKIKKEIEGKIITYRPETLREEREFIIPDIDYTAKQPQFFKIKTEPKKDLPVFRVSDVKNYAKELNKEISQEKTMLEQEAEELERELKENI